MVSKEKGLDRKTNHHDLTKVESEEIFVLTKAIEERETVASKLEQCEGGGAEATTLERQAAAETVERTEGV